MRNFKRVSHIRNERGNIALVGTIMAFGIGSIVILSNAQMFGQMARQNRNTVAAANANDMRREIETLFAEPAICAQNLNGQSPTTTGFSSTSFQDATGQNLISINTTTKDGTLKLTGWQLSASTVLDPGPPRRRIVDLNLRFEKTGDASGPKEVIRTIKLAVQQQGGGGSPIVSCYAISSAGTDLWSRDAGGTNIYNTNTNNVGINTIAPTSKLHVVGNTTATLETTATGVAVTYQPDAATTTSGRIDITGNLSVNGSGAIRQNAINGANRLYVVGDMVTSGNVQSTGAFSTGNVIASGNWHVFGNLGVAGASSLNTLNTTGTNSFLSTMTTGGTSTFVSPVTTQSTFGVNSYAGGATFGVSGATNILGTMTFPRFDTNNAICINGDCRFNFGTQTCPAGQVIRQVNADGTIVCSNPNCPANALFRGLNPDGSPICQTMAVPPCPANQYMSSVNPSTGARTCVDIPPNLNTADCNGNDRMQQITAGGRVCGTPTIQGGTCPVGQVARSIATDGTLTCGNPIVLQNCPAGQIARRVRPDGTVECSQPFPLSTCPSGQVAVGVNADGTASCQAATITGGSCASGSVVVGINTDGSPICGCPKMPLSWQIGYSICEATFGSTRVGMTSSGTDSIGSVTGSATFTCQSGGVWAPYPDAGATCTGAVPPPQVCPSATLVWSDGGMNYCYATAPETPVSLVVNLTSDVGTGTADFRCQPDGFWDPVAMNPVCGTGGLGDQWQWVPSTGSCPAGYGYAGVDDDASGRHHIPEEDYGGGYRTKLCGTIITGYQWASLWGACPGGYVDTLITDDNDGKHNLNEEGGSDVFRLCWQGPAAVMWSSTLTCPAGWTSTTITDDGGASHRLNEESGSRKRVLCARR